MVSFSNRLIAINLLDIEPSYVMAEEGLRNVTYLNIAGLMAHI